MTIQINRPDFLGTFAIQETGVDENILLMLPNVLVNADLPENTPFNNVLSSVNETLRLDKSDRVTDCLFVPHENDYLTGSEDNIIEESSSEAAVAFNPAAFYANLLPSLVSFPSSSRSELIADAIPTISPAEIGYNEINQTTDFEKNKTAFVAPDNLNVKPEFEIKAGVNPIMAQNLFLEPFVDSIEPSLANTSPPVMASDSSAFITLEEEVSALKTSLTQVLTEDVLMPTDTIQVSAERIQISAQSIQSQTDFGKETRFAGDNKLSIEPKAPAYIPSALPVTPNTEEHVSQENSTFFLTPGNEPTFDKKDFTSTIQSTDSVVKKPMLPNLVAGNVAANMKSVDALSSLVVDLDKKTSVADASIDNTMLSTHRDNTIKTISELSASEPVQNASPFDVMLNNVADFLNKKLTGSEPFMGKNKTNPLIINGDLYSGSENKSALKGFQFNASELGASLKVDGYSAKIKVYPPDLGQITAEILLNKGVTELTLRADNPQVKHFIETNLQQLRESFQNTTVHLGDIQVQNNMMPDKKDFQQQEPRAPFFNEVNKSSDLSKESQRVSAPRPKSNSLIDTYA